MDGFEINGMLWAAQVAEVAGVVGILTLLIGGAGMIFCTVEDLTDSDVFLWARRGFFAGVVALAVGTVLPWRDTIVYSAALDYGPEYAERLLAIIEKD